MSPAGRLPSTRPMFRTKGPPVEPPMPGPHSCTNPDIHHRLTLKPPEHTARGADPPRQEAFWKPGLQHPHLFLVKMRRTREAEPASMSGGSKWLQK